MFSKAVNKYDRVALDTNKLWMEGPAIAWQPEARSGDGFGLLARVEARLKLYVTGFLYGSGLWRRFIYANLKLGWFYEFREYWMKELGLRRLELPDFYFLSGTYRQRFQALTVSAANMFLQAWQEPAALYLLFHYQYKLALHPLAAYQLAPYIPRGARVCEYGCGLAPIAQCLVNFYRGKNITITAADIPSYMLHFVRWKFRATPFVRVAALDPNDNAPLKELYDVIACMTVFEHLPRPLLLVQHLHRQLKPGGIFMFDYIAAEGRGLDTKAAVIQRSDMLNFIREHFTVLRGTLPTDDRSVAAVICRKK